MKLETAVGLVPTPAEREAYWTARRNESRRATRAHIADYYAKTTPEIRRLFDLAGLDPERCLVRWGRADPCFLLSSKIYEPDEHGRSYRLRPRTKSVWLRQLTLLNGPFALLDVPDSPEVVSAARAAGAIVDEESRQTTNSWGLRGPEPNPKAARRGIVLGDSFMQGMFVGDPDTPPIRLQAYLEKVWRVPVSILNTGHIGYSPEQYYYTLKEYAPRFPPDFVVLSVCPNDFGEEADVVAGRGDWWDDAAFWIDAALQYCRSRDILCVLVPVPVDYQMNTSRKNAFYPGRVANIFPGSPLHYVDPLDSFIDEHLRLLRDGQRRGERPIHSPLYNRRIADNHFSPLGSELWAQVVGRRLTLLLPDPSPRSRETATLRDGF